MDGQRYALGAFTAGNTRHSVYRGWVGPGTGVGYGNPPPPDKECGNDLINRAAVGRQPFWIDEKKSPALGI